MSSSFSKAKDRINFTCTVFFLTIDWILNVVMFTFDSIKNKKDEGAPK